MCNSASQSVGIENIERRTSCSRESSIDASRKRRDSSRNPKGLAWNVGVLTIKKNA